MPQERNILAQRFRAASLYQVLQGVWKGFYYLVFARRAYRFAMRPLFEQPDIANLRMLCTGFPVLERCLPIRLDPLAAFGPRLLVLAAHPDDDTVGAGGAILQAVKAGARVRVVYVTDGGSGGASGYEGNRRVRLEEAAALARRYGYEFSCLDAPDGEFPVSLPLVQALAREMEGFGPTSVFLPWLLEAHPSHRQMNRLLLEVFRSRPFEAPVFAYSVWSTVPANVFLDISDTMDAKAEAVSQWKSQTSIFDYPNYVRGLNGFYSHLQSGRGYAEPFFNLPSGDYAALLARFYGGDAAGPPTP